MLKRVLIVTGVVALIAENTGVLLESKQNLPDGQSQTAPPRDPTPSQCLASIQAYAKQRQAEMRTLLPALPQNPTQEQQSDYQMKLLDLERQTKQAQIGMATKCLRTIEKSQVPDAELPTVIDLYIEANGTYVTMPNLALSLPAAQATVERARAIKGLPETDRAKVVFLALALAFREPKGETRTARLEAYVDELDSMSAATMDMKYSAHASMNSNYRGDDIDAGIIKHSTWLIETGGTSDPALRSRHAPALASAYVYKAEALAGQGMNDEALELLNRGLKDLTDFPYAARSITSVVPRYLLVGTPAAAITAPRWLNVPPTTARIDMEGHVTLLEFTAHWCGPCKESYPGLQRLLAKYGSQGFRVVLATQLYGSFGEDRNLTPDQEFDRDREYFKREGMNVPVAVSDRSTETVNGRLVSKPNPNDTAYKVSGIPQIQLIDRKGRIRLIMVGYDDANEPKLAKIIEGLLAERSAHSLTRAANERQRVSRLRPLARTTASQGHTNGAHLVQALFTGVELRE